MFKEENTFHIKHIGMPQDIILSAEKFEVDNKNNKVLFITGKNNIAYFNLDKILFITKVGDAKTIIC